MPKAGKSKYVLLLKSINIDKINAKYELNSNNPLLVDNPSTTTTFLKSIKV